MKMVIRNGNKPQELMTAKPSKYPQLGFKDKECKWCNDMFSPLAPSHMYCSDSCKDKGSTNNYYTKTYGVTSQEVQDLFVKQGGKCAICGSEGFKMNKWQKSGLVLDHCHTTGVVRGVLCNNCNRGLGLFQDNQESLAKAIIYLEGATTIP
jgi:hypothetical protein